MNLFHQLDMFCISETALHDASLAEEGTPLGRKLADLSLLYKNYHDYLHTRFSYEGSLLTCLPGKYRNRKYSADPVYGLTASTV